MILNRFWKIMLPLAVMVAFSSCNDERAELNLLPQPALVEQGSGFYALPEQVAVACADSSILAAADFMKYALPDAALDFAVGVDGDIRIALDASMDEGAYSLRVARRGIDIAASSYPAVISAIATLHQLSEAGETGRIPAVMIEDAPRFGWRGFMLDVSRHFFTVEEVKTLLQRLAEYKFNKFHWHLTDDQGWRIEIKAYPELTEIGAWRDPSKHNHDIICKKIVEETGDHTMRLPEDRLHEKDGKIMYGGYYTQEDIRDVVAFAATLGIDVIPEIDMPGHSLQIVNTHPEFSCSGRPGWGEVFTTPLCLGNDDVLTFCKNVYSEVFELFPFGYVHLGADEVEQSHWAKCPKCQARIKKLGLGDEKGLQTWFVHEMQEFFRENGRTLIGWDEIADENLSEDAVVQWWRGWAPDAFRLALENGNRVVVNPSEYTYLSAPQNGRTLLKIYGFEPAAGLEEYEDQMIALHANLWTETIPSLENACSHIFPAIFAISELAWRSSGKEFSDFEARALEHMSRLDADGWNYRIPEPEGFCNENLIIDSAVVKIVKPLSVASVRYTTDGSIPTAASPLYTESVVIKDECTLRLRSFNSGGYPGVTLSAVYKYGEFHEAVECTEELSEGLAYRWYDYKGLSCMEVETAKLNVEGVADQVTIPEEVRGNIGLVFNGYLDVPADDVYSIYLYSDDGSTLVIDGEMVINHDGPHSREERSSQVALRKGLHPVEIRYFDSNGGVLEMGYIDYEGRKKPIPAEWLKH